MTTALTVLQAADADLRGWSCPCSTDCCHFDAREPSVTAAEWALITAALAREGRRIPPAARPRDACPFLDEAAGRCTIYAVRPLGCRTYFCDDGVGPRVKRASLREHARDLEALSRDKGRPLRRWVAAAG